ncbi:MAG: hypothetical protein ACFFAS_02640 [Promethearchaeota archaeon]
MESIESISELKINIDKVTYDKKSKVLVIELPGFTFIGNYNKNVRISAILNDVIKVLEEKGIKLDRENIYFFKDIQKLHGNTKLKNLLKIKLASIKPVTTEGLPEKKEGKKRLQKPKKGGRARSATLSKEEKARESVAYDLEDDTTVDLKKREEDISVRDELLLMEEETEEELEAPEEAPKAKMHIKRKVSASEAFVRAPAPSAPAPAPPPPGGAPKKMMKEDSGPEMERELRDEGEFEPLIASTGDEQKPTEYNINMGFQYYSVMMEKRSYLFYVYFSHQELKIKDEEGKTVYTTTVKIVTKKKEPPILDLKIEGEDFEIHPLPGRVEVKKDAVNPPVMIFSVMPLKSGRLKKKDESERRFLNVFIHFEGELLSHTILSIIVQPKHFKLKLGPLSFNMNKGAAIAVSVTSICVSILLLLYSIFTFDPTSFTGVDVLTNFVPQISAVIFVVIFLYTLVKGVYPLKQQFAGLLNFDSGSGFEK